MPQQPGDIFEDDPSIPDDMCLLRRVPPNRVVTEEKRPQSDTFSNSSDGTGTSVDLAIDENQIERTLADFPDFGVVAVTAGQVRALGLGVIRDPLPENANHALITGNKKKTSKLLVRLCEWKKLPKGCEWNI